MRKNILSRADIIKVGKFKYLIYKASRSNLVILPIDKLLEGEHVNLIPKITVERKSIFGYELLDRYDILYLVGRKNPLINETIEYFINEETKRRENQEYKS